MAQPLRQSLIANELSIETLGHGASGLSRFFDCIELSRIVPYTMMHHLRRETAFNNLDAFMSRRVAQRQPGVCHVAGRGCSPKVVNSVICRITVNVVDRIRDRLPMNQQPSEPVRGKMVPQPNINMTKGVVAAGRHIRIAGVPTAMRLVVAKMLPRSFAPTELTRVRVVAQALANVVNMRQSFTSHNAFVLRLGVYP
jgi:hypothetical protein